MPNPLVVQQMNTFRAQLAAGEEAAERTMARQWLSVERALQGEAEATARHLAQLKAAGRTISPGLLARDDRFQSLLAQTGAQVNRYAPQAERIITARQRIASRLGVDHSASLIQAVAVRAQFDRLPVAAVENMVGLAGDGSPLVNTLRRSYADGADGILDEMIRGFAMGRGPAWIARNALRNGLSRSLNHMMLVNRTETNRVYRETSRQAFEISGIVPGYKRIAAKSPRTCMGCLMGDGAFYLIAEAFDEHPQGRCGMIPVVQGAPVPTWEHGRTWFEKQTPGVQRKMMGPGRYDAWQAGKFDLAQLVTLRQDATWGNSLHPTTLADLLAGRGGVTFGSVPRIDPLPLPPPKVKGGTSPELLGDVVSFATGQAPDKQLILNGIKLQPMEAPDFAKIPDKVIKEPPFNAGGKRRSAGVIMVEDDGRIWIVEPKGHFGGYQNTFPKGGLEPGLTVQQSAIREVFEETGLLAEIDDFLIDGEGTTSVTRYYVGRRVGGAPWLGDAFETANVKLVTPDKAADLLNVQRDQKVLAALRARSTKVDDVVETVAEAPIPPVVPKAPLPDLPLPAAFPDDPERLEVVRRLGGSTGAELVRDPSTGKMYVRKRGADAGHIREEAFADRAYRALGVNVPEFHLYETPGRPPIKLAEFIEGRTLKAVRQSDKRAFNRAVKELRKDFAADALLGNWDVVGMDFDNVLVDSAGKVWRIDNGGSLRRRAQGGLKARWDRYVDELWTLRNPATNAQTAEVFGDLAYSDIMKQARAIEKKRAALLASLPDELQATVAGRLDVLADLADIHKVMTKDAWADEYLDDFARHSIGIRKAGIVDKLPKKLTNSGVNVRDENGVAWDNLRSRGYGGRSLIADVFDYIDGNGGNSGTISQWAGAQAGSSWSSEAQAVKYFYATQRTIDPAASFWWRRGIDEAKGLFANSVSHVGEAKMRETLTAWHAWNYEFMRNVQFRNNNLKKGVVKLIRTESADVMRLNNLARGQTGTLLRGPVESTSIFQKVSVFGTEVTTQQVPHHRVFGVYIYERSPGYSASMFMGDHENEIVAMLDGVKVKYGR